MGQHVPVHVDGKTFPSLNKAAKHYGVPQSTAYERYKEKGWTLRQALGLDAAPDPYVVDGETFTSLAEATRHFGVPYSTAQRRLTHDKWTLRQALGLDAPPPRRQRYARRDAIFARSNAVHRTRQTVQHVYVTEVTFSPQGDIAVTRAVYRLTDDVDGQLVLQNPQDTAMTSIDRDTLDAVEPDVANGRWTYASLIDDRQRAETLAVRRAIADVRDEKRRLTKWENRLTRTLRDLHTQKEVNL